MMERELEVVKLLSDVTRFRIFKMLQHRPAFVCEITHVLGLTMATVSIHLSKMRMFGIVSSERDGNKIRYFLTQPEDDKKLIFEMFLRLGENWRVVKSDRRKLDSLKLEEVCPSKDKEGAK
jgi:ArsR family transcriptional regulator